MIRVKKPREAPGALKRTAKAAQKAICKACGASKDKSKLPFDASVYAHPDVKAALVECHYEKCCYCESKVRHVGHGDVEHYRPKAAVKQTRKGMLERPGYYWLAYEWDNLLFSCTYCNASSKKNLFPLRDPSKRARDPKAGLFEEEPLLLHPAVDDPEQYIGFRAEYAFSKEGNERGTTTINEVLLLNDRSPLVERRREHLARVHQCIKIVELAAQLPEDVVHDAKQWLMRATSDAAEYASMTRTALARQPSRLR